MNRCFALVEKPWDDPSRPPKAVAHQNFATDRHWSLSFVLNWGSVIWLQSEISPHMRTSCGYFSHRNKLTVLIFERHVQRKQNSSWPDYILLKHSLGSISDASVLWETIWGDPSNSSSLTQVSRSYGFPHGAIEKGSLGSISVKIVREASTERVLSSSAGIACQDEPTHQMN